MGWDSYDKKDVFIKNKIVDFIATIKYQTTLDEYFNEEQEEQRIS